MFHAAVAAGLFPLAVVGIAASVIGAYYYLRVVKTMYFDDPAPAFPPMENKVEGGLIAIAAVFISPVGYLAIPLIGGWTIAAAHSLF